VLLQSFGSEHSGYFAVDVTNPVPDPSDPDDLTKGGPRLLWQLTRDSAGNNLFGRGGATPAITTLFFDPSGGNSPREIPVAILPGGPGGTQITSGSGCPSTPRNFGSSNIPSAFAPRTKVHCYDFSGTSEIGARSLTIVRLDTGEIIRTFRQSATEVNSVLAQRVTEVEIDSPITGQPMPFPPQVGTVADRIFVGDADGRLWKVDVSAKKPADWTMKLFFDLYPETLSNTFSSGQPLELPPALSVDENGNVTLNVATGSQERLGVGTTKNYVFALMDKATGPEVGWYQLLPDPGERVLGPMVVFNSAVYFATYVPPAEGDSCGQGTSRVWGMHFIRREGYPLSTDLSKGGDRPPGVTSGDFSDVDRPYLDMQDILGNTEDEGVIAGISLAQQPSCFTELTDTAGDDVLGFRGQHTLSQVTAGKFQLIVHTGSKTGASTSGGAVNTAAIDLPQPPALSFSSAWATIDE
jgi:type IV pilus assembly protein PilY1